MEGAEEHDRACHTCASYVLCVTVEYTGTPVEEHHPELVFCQFGMKQVPSELMDMSVDLHRISLQGKLERTWPQKHAGYIERWAHRGEQVAKTPTLDGDMMYLVAYMELYRRMTRRSRSEILLLSISDIVAVWLLELMWIIVAMWLSGIIVADTCV
ncbi:hypothetical protein SO802_026117 [Lithocarpus litseifolius]|uniref:Uncharacterized protein n=1 Tax=Lithocarpus litseifolius TaxID=425828 RepID=A0AAW2C0J7_9ROSI